MIVASNGMLTGGRVVGHLRNLIDDPTATILFVGYQGEGTLGAHLQAGAETVKLDGQVRRVRCQVRSISGFSAHADESELLDWLRPFADGKPAGDAGYPRQVFIRVGREAADRADLAAHRRTWPSSLTVFAPAWRCEPSVPLPLVADEQDRRRRVVDEVAQVADDTTAGQHPVGRHDHVRPRSALDRLRLPSRCS